MDDSVIAKHYEMISKTYPTIDATQLGMVMILLASLRSTMGHEGIRGTIDNYIHVKQLSDDIRICLDFIERELLAIKKSKLDIDYWKIGNTGDFRRDYDKPEV